MSSWFDFSGLGAGFGGSGAGFGGSGAAGKKRKQDDDDPKCNVCKKNSVIQHETGTNEVYVCIDCFLCAPGEHRGSLTDVQVDLICEDHYKRSAAVAARMGGAASARFAPEPLTRMCKDAPYCDRAPGKHWQIFDHGLQVEPVGAGGDRAIAARHGDRPGARADGKKPAHHGAASSHARAHKPSIHDPVRIDTVNGPVNRTVHVWVTNAKTGRVLILNNTGKKTWDLAGGKSNAWETVWEAGRRELVEEIRGCGKKPKHGEGWDAMERKKNQMKVTLDYMLENKAVHACVLHSGEHSVNIALVFKCKDDVKFINLLGLPNLEAETDVKAYKTYMSNEHMGWLLVYYQDLKEANAKRQMTVLVHDKPVPVTLTNRKMSNHRLIDALGSFLEDVNNPGVGK